MANKFGLKLGEYVNVSTHTSGGIAFDSWQPGSKLYQGKIVGFDGGGYPLLYIPNADSRSGAWACGANNKGHFKIDPSYFSEIPDGLPCLIQCYDEKAFQRTSGTPITKTGSDKLIMKHNLKVGDRVVVAMSSASTKPAAYCWSKNGTSKYLTATVIGQKNDGQPLVYFDDNPGYSFMWDWMYNYGHDTSNIDPKYQGKVELNSKRCWGIEEHTAFVLEADYKVGKAPNPKAMPLKTAWEATGSSVNASIQAADARDFMEHLGANLRDDTQYLYGDQFKDLFAKQVPMSHQVFVPSAAAMTTFATSLRNNFGESAMVHHGVIPSSNPDLIVNEYTVRWKSRDSITKQFKVHIATPANANVKSPFQKGGVDVAAFQMFGPGTNYLIKNFASEDFNAVIDNITKKQFTAFGEANKAAIEELIRQGFSSQGKIKQINKEINKMANGSEKTASFAEMMKADFQKATYRVAADQMTHGIKEGIVALIGTKGGTEAQQSGMMILLDSEIGEAAIAMLAGLGLTYAPMVSEDPRAQKLAGEFRVNGMAKAGNVLIENLLGTFLPIVQKALASLPAEEQVRVAETAPPARIGTPVAEEEEEEQTVSAGKKAVA